MSSLFLENSEEIAVVLTLNKDVTTETLSHRCIR